MNEPTLKEIFAELEAGLTGRKFGKVFSLSRYRFAFDFRLPDSKYLYISIEPTSPRIYFIRRRFRDLEEQSKGALTFLLLLRKRLSNSVISSIEKIEDERVIRFGLTGRDDVGKTVSHTLIAQLTGRSSNLFLLDERDLIIDACRENTGIGQNTAERYGAPLRTENRETFDPPAADVFDIGQFESLSEALDDFYLQRETAAVLQNRATSARNYIKREIAKRKRLIKNLGRDLSEHGEPDQWKRFGDLILANLVTAERTETGVIMTDFYDPETPRIEIEVDKDDSLKTAAEKFFKRYTKARNAQREISGRLEAARSDHAGLLEKKEQIEEAIREENIEFLSRFGKSGKSGRQKTKDKKAGKFSGAREFASSDGFEILVGRRSKDNDYLTFRIAKSGDLWLHAADYPGSHVIVKNPNRREIPPGTLVEAAQLAAFYSRAKSQPKAAVNYTEKKFVNKPKGAVPGLVSLASFKTILVEPKAPADKK